MKSKNGLLWLAVAAALVSGLIVGALAVVLFAAVFGADAAEQEQGGPEDGGPPPASVRVGTVDIQTLQHRVPVVGRLEEVRRVTVTAEIEGKVTDLAVNEGDAVTGGQTKLAQIDKVWADLRLKAAEADVAAAEAELTQARNDLGQLEQLKTAGSARAKEVDDARTLVAANQARLNGAVAQRDRARTEAERSAIVAPFDGAVSRTLVEVGQWVEPGEGVVEMISSGEIDAVVDVPERFVNTFAVGDGVEVVIDAVNERVVGKIVSVRPDGTNASRTFPVKIRLTDLDTKLRAGMSVIAHLPITREGPFITVPRDAVLFSPGGASVWYAQNMGGPMPAALPEPVNVLFGVGDRYAVEPLPGAAFPALNQGTKVVIEGAERLFPTQPLAFEPDPGAVPASAPAPGDTTEPDAGGHEATPPAAAAAKP
ncbi:MAG: efflux RND transporter periplasmic adaptor subunit [Planctomycetota bacterium]